MKTSSNTARTVDPLSPEHASTAIILTIASFGEGTYHLQPIERSSSPKPTRNALLITRNTTPIFTHLSPAPPADIIDAITIHQSQPSRPIPIKTGPRTGSRQFQVWVNRTDNLTELELVWRTNPSQ